MTKKNVSNVVNEFQNAEERGNVKIKALELIPEKTGVYQEETEIHLDKDEEIKKLREELEVVKEKLSREPKDVEGKIEYYQRKQELISKLKRLGTSKIKLEEHLNELDVASQERDFECDKYVLNVQSKDRYRDDVVFSMNNPVLIGEVIKFVIVSIENKIETLKVEIAE